MKVLSTKLLSAKHLALFNDSSITITDYDAIHINYLSFSITNKTQNHIFTSKNAVNAFINQLPKSFNIKAIKCFCVGKKTSTLLKKHNFHVVETYDYGKDLANAIVKLYPTATFVFYCSNKRRDDIPNILKSKDIPLKEITAYKTSLNIQEFSNNFKGVLFFSPSGVQSFTAANDLDNSVTAFCIGITTAKEAEKHTSNIVIAAKPTIKQTLKEVKRYYN